MINFRLWLVVFVCMCTACTTTTPPKKSKHNADINNKIITSLITENGKNQELLEDIKRRIALETTLSDEDILLNQKTMLQMLTALPKAQLESIPKTLDVFGGWIELALIVKKPSSLTPKIRRLDDWKKIHFNHPLQQALYQEIILDASEGMYLFTEKKFPDYTSNIFSRGKKVTLLLPLSGPLQKISDEILSGIMAAYYLQPMTNRPSLQIVDSENKDIASLYQMAVERGAEIVIGPLKKTSVEALTKITLQVPVLALNSISNTHTNLYQFGLSPEDDINAMIDVIWATGKRNMATMSPDTAWGKRVISFFHVQWLSKGGKITIATQYPLGVGNYAQSLEAIVNTAPKINTHLKKAQIPVALDVSAQTQAIFLLAANQQARQIMPQILFHRLYHLPVYSSSHIYAPKGRQALNTDLDGIYFCDLPWMIKGRNNYAILEDNNPLVKSRMFALGFDALSLQDKLYRDVQFNGLTGLLVMQAQYIQRYRLALFKFERGKPVLQ